MRAADASEDGPAQLEAARRFIERHHGTVLAKGGCEDGAHHRIPDAEREGAAPHDGGETPRRVRGETRSHGIDSVSKGMGDGIPAGVHISEIPRRARTMRQMTVTCPGCEYERTVPHVVIPLVDWPSSPTSSLLDAAMDDGEYRACLKRIGLLVGVRERSSHEMQERLKSEGFLVASVDRAMQRAVAYSWIDDSRYARAFVMGKRGSGWGSARIRRELEHSGVEDVTIEETMRTVDEEGGVDELDRALEALSSRRFSGRKAHDAMYRRLIAKGFSSEISSRAATRYLEEHPECLEGPRFEDGH